jgi:hypothetical protein
MNAMSVELSLPFHLLTIFLSLLRLCAFLLLLCMVVLSFFGWAGMCDVYHHHPSDVVVYAHGDQDAGLKGVIGGRRPLGAKLPRLMDMVVDPKQLIDPNSTLRLNG